MIIFEVGSNASSSVIVQCPLTLNAWLDSTKPLFALLLEMHTMPELMTISALALSWLSAMMLPFEKYFVSLRSKSCNKNGWNDAWTRMMKGVNSNEVTKQRLNATFHSIDISKMFQLYINLILLLSARDLHPSTVTKTSWVSHWELGDRLAHCRPHLSGELCPDLPYHIHADQERNLPIQSNHHSSLSLCSDDRVWNICWGLLCEHSLSWLCKYI